MQVPPTDVSCETNTCHQAISTSLRDLLIFNHNHIPLHHHNVRRPAHPAAPPLRAGPEEGSLLQRPARQGGTALRPRATTHTLTTPPSSPSTLSSSTLSSARPFPRHTLSSAASSCSPSCTASTPSPRPSPTSLAGGSPPTSPSRPSRRPRRTTTSSGSPTGPSSASSTSSSRSPSA